MESHGRLPVRIKSMTAIPPDSPAVAPHIPHTGLFDRLFRNPILIRELRVGGRSIRIMVAHAIVLLIQAFCFIVVMLVTSPGFGFSTKDIGQYTFIAQSVIMLVIVCAVFPAFSCTAIVSERDRNSLDLLSMTHFEPWELVWGKLVSAVVHSSLFAVSALPLYVLSVSYGGFPPGAVVLALGLMIPLSMLLAAVGIYLSTVVRRPMGAMAATYIASFGIGFLVWGAGFALIQSWLGRHSGLVEWLTDGSMVQRGLLFVAVIGSLVVNTAFLVTASIVRLKLEGEDRATPLRIVAVVSALLGITVFSLGFSALDAVSAHVFVWITLIAFSVIAFFSIMPGIKVTGESAFPPRGIARKLNALPQPRRFIRWLLGPGSTPALLLSSVLLAITLGTIAAFTSYGVVQRAETVTISDLDSVYRLSTFNEATYSAVDAAKDDLRASLYPSPAMGGVQPLHTEEEAGVLLARAYGEFAWLPWKLMGTALLVLVAFGSIAWWLSFSPRQTKAATVIGVSSLLFALLIPVWVGAAMEANGAENRVYALSPGSLWVSVIDSSVLDSALATQPSIVAQNKLTDARDSLSTDLYIGYGLLLAIATTGFTFGWFRRKKALVMRAEHNGRWPIPFLPPPRDFVASRQTGLGPAEVIPMTHRDPFG